MDEIMKEVSRKMNVIQRRVKETMIRLEASDARRRGSRCLKHRSTSSSQSQIWSRPKLDLKPPDPEGKLDIKPKQKADLEEEPDVKSIL